MGTRLLVAATSLLAACAQGGFAPPAAPARADERTVVEAPFERSWSVVVRTLFDLNLPIRTIEKASGLVETEDLRAEIGRGCDCGTYLGIPVGGYGAYGGDAQFKYRLLIQPEGPTRTSIMLRSSCVSAVAELPNLVCRLDPVKEETLRNEIRARIAAEPAPAAPSARPHAASE
ncbi:MAG: hypothetical protein ACREQJ_10645 [Candidatus Binatia bacterium]